MKKSDYFLIAFIGLVGFIGARYLSTKRTDSVNSSITDSTMGWNPFVNGVGQNKIDWVNPNDGLIFL